MATNLGSKVAKLDYLLLIVALAFRNGLQYRHSYCKMFICDAMATFYVHLMNFSPVTPEFLRVKDVHLVVFFFKLNISDKVSRDPSNRFSPSLHRHYMVGM